jgi:Na+/H+ antiporter NhaC
MFTARDNPARALDQLISTNPSGWQQYIPYVNYQSLSTPMILYYLIAVAVVGLLMYQFRGSSSDTSTTSETSSEYNTWFWMVIFVIVALVAAAMYTGFRSDMRQYTTLLS